MEPVIQQNKKQDGGLRRKKNFYTEQMNAIKHANQQLLKQQDQVQEIVRCLKRTSTDRGRERDMEQDLGNTPPVSSNSPQISENRQNIQIVAGDHFQAEDEYLCRLVSSLKSQFPFPLNNQSTVELSERMQRENPATCFTEHQFLIEQGTTTRHDNIEFDSICQLLTNVLGPQELSEVKVTELLQGKFWDKEIPEDVKTTIDLNTTHTFQPPIISGGDQIADVQAHYAAAQLDAAVPETVYANKESLEFGVPVGSHFPVTLLPNKFNDLARHPPDAEIRLHHGKQNDQLDQLLVRYVALARKLGCSPQQHAAQQSVLEYLEFLLSKRQNEPAGAILNFDREFRLFCIQFRVNLSDERRAVIAAKHFSSLSVKDACGVWTTTTNLLGLDHLEPARNGQNNSLTAFSMHDNQWNHINRRDAADCCRGGHFIESCNGDYASNLSWKKKRFNN